MGEQPKGTNWGMVCGVGCGLLVLVVILIAVFGYFGVRKGMDALNDTIRAEALPEMLANYEAAKANAALSPEDTALFDDIMAKIQSEDASMWGIMIGSAAVLDALEDGEVSDSERSLAVDVQTLLQSPDVGVMEMGQFMEAHPEMQGAMQDMERQFNVPGTVTIEENSSGAEAEAGA